MIKHLKFAGVLLVIVLLFAVLLQVNFSGVNFMAAVGSLSAFELSTPSVQCVSGLPEVTLSWTPSSRATSYMVQRKTSPTLQWSGSIDSQIKVTTYVDKRWQSDYGAVAYYYRIVAVKNSSRAYSNEVSIAVPDCRVPQPVPLPAPTPTPTPSPPSSTSTPATTTPTLTGKIPSWVSWGAYVGWQDYDMTNFESLVGKKPQSEMIFAHWGNDLNFPSWYAPRIRDQGRTMVLYWEAVDYNRDYFSQPEYSFDAVLAGKLDAYFRNFAAGAKAYGGPVILIPYSEFNGNWYPWGGTIGNNTPEKFIASYRHIHDFFVDVPNVKFGWAPNADAVPSVPQNALELYYPGDAYVDYVGVDGFNFGGAYQETFSQLFNDSLTRLKVYHKPIYIFSFASAEYPGKAAWITDALTVQLYKYPEVVGWLWFNANKENDWRVNSGVGTLDAFKNALP